MEKDRSKYASLLDRLAAFAVDWVMLALISSAASYLAGFEYPTPDQLSDIGTTEILAQSAGILVGWVYYAGMESSKLQATIGKQFMNIKVVDTEESRISFGKATIRHFSKFLSALIFGIGFLMIAFTEKKQGLHDMIAGCLVTRNKEVQPKEAL